LSFVRTLVDYVLHLDHHLVQLIQAYGAWTYLILFAIVFLETGLVVTPFLPGDSLLFAAGALAAKGAMDVWVLFAILSVAAVLGDSVNYWIGRAVGPRVFREDVRFLNRKHLDRTHRFYEKHGGKTIFLARFVPIVRTFAPFVAGVGTMNYARFWAYNVVGGVVWVGGFLLAGYWFGNLPVVKNNFSLVILGIIVVSVLPIAYEVLRARREEGVGAS
jgi:membrane-associated protein